MFCTCEGNGNLVRGQQRDLSEMRKRELSISYPSCWLYERFPYLQDLRNLIVQAMAGYTQDGHIGLANLEVNLPSADLDIR